MEICTQRREGAGPLEKSTAPDAAHVRNRRAGSVLIVDDDPAVRLICALNLAAEGLLVREAEDGLDAIEQAQSVLPDLVLTDVKMPGLDGFQLAERLRRDKRTCRIPLIFLSGEVEQANVERAQALGASAYLTKPFDPGELASYVARELVAARAAWPGLAAATAS